ncbi:YaiI/YqxD family protein [Vibrio breoganii]|uniref:YaiI/YqxD family protein n=1 Tax=Vibrio breoganii TaxID=553239 RepID=UPI000C84A9FF|nr:YaiI/YqxD family protein [Vibrio breoganii]PMG03191.1 hypothetical protein BCV08_00810 [Vibrio breoganii]TKG22999.1 YaiI/YqxD family protein [Vibrio breoganii]
MKIWVDADACPKVIRETLVRASERTGIECIFVANHPIPLPKRNTIRFVQVSQGFDIADDEIALRIEANDLVITSDIPLADEVITKGGQALSSRGELFTKENIKARLNVRDFMDTMRSSGVQTGGPSALSQTERRDFANTLDRILARAKK